MVAVGGCAQVSGVGERGGGHEVAVAEAGSGRESAEGRRQEAGREGVARSYGGDYVHLEGSDEGDRVARVGRRGLVTLA